MATEEAVPAIVVEELAALHRTRTTLSEHPFEVAASEGELVGELERIRDEMLRAKEEDRGSLSAQFDQHYAVLQRVRASKDRSHVDPDSPYFAHLRLVEDGRTRDVFLGKATRIDHGLRVVDWRNAPVSRIFYRYQEGEEYEEELGGRLVEGEVRARRLVTVRRGELERVESPQGVFAKEESGWTTRAIEAHRLAGGEGAALRAHGVGAAEHRRLGTDLAGDRRRQDKRLPDIAGLLDPEQFALITRPSTGFVVIRGTAGSGKTTVALHRIAWLAFEDPTIDSPNTLFLVLSRALKDYVAHVLPALGVHKVAVRGFHEWAAQLRQRHFPKLPREPREDTPADVVRLKQHPALLYVLANQVRRTTAPPTPEQALDDWVSALTDRGLWLDSLARLDPDAFSDAELDRALTWCRDRAEVLARHLEGDAEEDDDPRLDVEDDPILLRAWQLRVGPLRKPDKRPLQYRHVALDEVQDLAPLDVRVLLDCLDQHQSITLAGDTQQHVMQASGFTSWAAFFHHLGVSGTAVDTLRVAYRSSRPVVQLAQAVLGELREDEAPPIATREGPEVELFQFTDHGACVAFLAGALTQLLRDEPLANVALVVPDIALGDLYESGLHAGEVPQLRRVVDQQFSFAPGVEIVEVPDVKGLEFDYVVLIEASAAHYPDVPSARRLLHVGVTRAVHQLWITCVGAPSPILRDALVEVGQPVQ